MIDLFAGGRTTRRAEPPGRWISDELGDLGLELCLGPGSDESPLFDAVCEDIIVGMLITEYSMAVC